MQTCSFVTGMWAVFDTQVTVRALGPVGSSCCCCCFVVDIVACDLSYVPVCMHIHHFVCVLISLNPAYMNTIFFLNP